MGVFLMLRVELVVDFVRCFVLYLCTIEETHIDERSKELKSKDEIIAQKEKIVQEKSNSITQLQNEIVSLQVSHLDSHCAFRFFVVLLFIY